MQVIHQNLGSWERRKGGENGMLWGKWKLDLLE